MNIVSFGGGTNSTALLIGMYRKGIPVDLILFADTGAESPHTYEFVQRFGKWLKEHGMPEITVVKNVNKDGDIFTLEQECLQSKSLPSIAYGWKKCSLKHKIGPQDKFCTIMDLVKRYGIIVNKKYKKVYALIDWGWYREDCIRVIHEEGVPLPGKSSCFFCPSMKKPEIKHLRRTHPELFARAIAIEENAQESLVKVKGLGRNYAWKDFMEWEDSQISMCEFYEENEISCSCYDG
ncbi:MAG: hypothetical protein H2212_19055 [Ruminococcus sp.]|jgi:hypothetical protein|nr:hypothetical protein [Ruminococcus sp.]